MAIYKTASTILFTSANGAYGTGDESWTDANNALANDFSYATVNKVTPSTWTSKTLLVTVPGLNGLSFPYDVDTISIVIKRHATNNNGDITYIRDANVQLYIDGSLQGDNKAFSNNWNTGTTTSYIYGGSDTWGLTLTNKNFNSTSGVGISINGRGNNTASINAIYIGAIFYYFNGIFVP